jgi:hypothetical protein
VLGGVVAQDPFGLGLGEKQQERVGGVGKTQVEQPYRDHPMWQVHPQLDGLAAVVEQGRGDAKVGEHFQGAGLDRRRYGFVDPVGLAVDDAHPGAGGGQVGRHGESGWSGTHDQDLDRAVTGAGWVLAGCHSCPCVRHAAWRPGRWA